MTKSTLWKFGAAGLFLSSVMAPQPLRGQEISQAVARISHISGPVSYSRGDDPDEWDAAVVNVPFTLGDRLYAPRDGRAELQLPGGNFVRLGHGTYFTALNLTYDVRQFYLGAGAAAFNIRNLGPDEVFEIDTPNTAVTLESGGRYRVEVDEEGNSRVSVRRGRVVVAAQGRQITVEQGEIRIYGTDAPRYEIVALPGPDGFDRWVDERESRFERAYPGAYRYASDQIVGVEELADYGRWEEIPEHGYAWTPTAVPAGWQPFTAGHWFWQDPWGWTWISGEPWGWAPCHYGRWTFHRSRWYWIPVKRRVVVVRYVPAVVGFVRFRDHVGWFPLHPRDRFIPWWGARTGPQNFTFVNRTNIVIVNHNTFISARNVSANIVRDAVVAREATAARVMEQPLPIPSRSSLRVAAAPGRERSEGPPARFLSRPAVVRTAPPPPVPTFQDKLPEIERSRGEPVAPEKAMTLGLKHADQSRRNPIRPAAVEAGRADFAPRAPDAAAPSPQPLTPARGKKLATPEEPVLTDQAQRRERRESPPAQPEGKRPAPAEPSTGAAGPPEAQERQQREPRKEQQREDERRRELERRQKQDEERLQKKEQERQEPDRQIQEQRQREQPQLQKERRELERPQPQDRERPRQEKQLPEKRRDKSQPQQEQRREEDQKKNGAAR